MLTRLHVNQHNIKRNAKGGDCMGRPLPVISIKSGGKTVTANNVAIIDDNGKEVARIVYSPDKPLSCGARVWIETKLGWRAV